ncbi:hypothetical protein BGZ76_007019, partial [Entomortierella beljakovae]
MADIISGISNLATIIFATASKVKVDKHACMQLARKVIWIEKEVREKGPKCKKTHTLESMEQLLVQCASDLRKFEKKGKVFEPVSVICDRHILELDFWMEKIEQAVRDDQ